MHIKLILGILAQLKQHRKSPVSMIFWKTLQKLFLLGFLAGDHALLFTTSAFTKRWTPEQNKRLTWWALLCWVLSCVCEVIYLVVDI